MCECNWIHKQILKAFENYFRGRQITPQSDGKSLFHGIMSEKNLAMMTV